MDWLKDRKHKIMVSLIAGMAAALLAAGMPGQIENNNTLAWWGVMYPKFCFVQEAEESGQAVEESGQSAEESGQPTGNPGQPGSGERKKQWLGGSTGYAGGRKVKISFWLAKALDW